MNMSVFQTMDTRGIPYTSAVSAKLLYCVSRKDRPHQYMITVVLDGIMTEELFNKQQTGVILHTLTREFRMDELSHTYLTTIHRASNVHTGGLVAIHICFPPLTLMNIYNLKDTHIEKWTADYASKL